MGRDWYTDELNASKETMERFVGAMGEGSLTGEALDAGMRWLQGLNEMFNKIQKIIDDGKKRS